MGNCISTSTSSKQPASPTVIEYMEPFDISDKGYQMFSEALLNAMIMGLGKDTQDDSSVKMFPSYVRTLPDGTESGNYLALDLGGTNFRVLLLMLEGAHVDMVNKTYQMTEDKMTGPGVELFDFLVECIYDFLNEKGLLHDEFKLGFTFSFPLLQEGLAVGTLVRWTKGFSCPDVVGKNVVTLLQDAIARHGELNVTCVVVLNDTVGCLVSCAYDDHDAKIGVIVATGMNACYMEKLENVEIWNDDRDEPKQTIICTEYGSFGSNGEINFLKTDVDEIIDNLSINPGQQTYEKMVAGMYLGEIARQCIVACAKKGDLLGGNITAPLETFNRFHAKYLSEIAKDLDESNTNTRDVLEELGYTDLTANDLRDVKYICNMVGKRAAYLAAAGIVTLINRVNEPHVSIGVDGSLYRFHPLFQYYMEERIQAMIKEGLTFKLIHSEDGSGKGAALIAAVAGRLSQATA